MRDILETWPQILESISSAKPVLMLDFDGTLAPIAPSPSEAEMSEQIRELVRRCSKCMPVCIISGRPMADIETKVRIESIDLIANHGTERRIRGNYHTTTLSKKSRRELARVHRVLEPISMAHEGSLLEDKTYSIVFHYRRVPTSGLICLKAQAYAALEDLKVEGIQVTESERSLEFRVQGLWNKGDAVRFYCTEVGGRGVPFFVGDEPTDEDAFRALPSGVTIRVGASKRSAARYYMKDRSWIRSMLTDLVALCDHSQT